jgi:hypothetical protein
MKRVILSLVLTALLSAGFNAQTAADAKDVDIRALVLKQMENAQKNLQNKEEFKSVNKENGKEVILQKNKEKISNDNLPSNDAELEQIAAFLENTKTNIWTKLTNLPPFKRQLLPYFLLIEAVLLGTILVVYLVSRRSSFKRTEQNVKNLKEAVRKMREERLGSKFNPEVSKLRSSLMMNAIRIDDGGREITCFAKKQGIAKGEVFLAMKVRILSNMHK